MAFYLDIGSAEDHSKDDPVVIMLIIKAADHDIRLIEKSSQAIVIVMDNDMVIFCLRITENDDPIVGENLDIVDISNHLPASLSAIGDRIAALVLTDLADVALVVICHKTTALDTLFQKLASLVNEIE